MSPPPAPASRGDPEIIMRSTEAQKFKPAGSQPGKAKIFAVVAVAAVVVIALASYLAISRKAAKEGTESFRLLMDQAFGAEGWSVENIDVSVFDKLLTARGVSIKPGHASFKEPTTVESLEIHQGLPSEELQALLARADWRSAPETRLASRVVFNGLDIKAPDASGEKVIGTIKLKSVELDAPTLAASGPETSPGLLGFLKSVRLSRVVSRDLQIASTDEPATLSLGHAEAVNPRFGESWTDLNDPLEALLALSATELSYNDLKFQATKDQNNVTFEIGEQRLQGMGENFKFDQASLKNFIFKALIEDDDDAEGAEDDESAEDDEDAEGGEPQAAKAAQPGVDVNLRLGEFVMEGLDLSALFRRFEELAVLAAISDLDSLDDPVKLANFYNDAYRLSDLLVAPYSLKRAHAKDLSLDIDGQLKAAMAAATFEGPFEAGKLAPKQTFALESLKIELPTKAEPGSRFAEVAEFSQKFGQSVFNLAYNFDAVYDEAAKTLTWRATPLLGEAELVDLNLSFVFAGLTPSLIEEMSQITLGDAETIFLSPQFASFGLAQAQLEIVNRALVDKLYAMAGQEQGMDKDLVKEALAASLELFVGPALESSFEGADQLVAAAQTFLRDPQSIALTVGPPEPLNWKALTEATSQPQLLNALKMNLAVNGQAPTPVVWLEAPPDHEADDEEGFDDEDDFDESDE
ncbi:MAG: hypothetical protein LBU12_08840 [Deltaproteobacteria bacterium]|jgi:hypothetical protein|nr:hypothetical protein [Deltaproteobacteria bacterium]